MRFFEGVINWSHYQQSKHLALARTAATIKFHVARVDSCGVPTNTAERASAHDPPSDISRLWLVVPASPRTLGPC